MNLAEARRRAHARPELKAFISYTTEDGEGPAVAVKDLIDVAGTVTTAGGRHLPATPAIADAAVITEIRRHGAGVMGKTNLHEYAYGVTNVNLHFGAALNPAALDHITGGSSGGSAAAVAAGLCDWAIGSDTGGSIRIPAALCGVVGIKPSLGLIDTDGVFPLSRSLDTLGPLAPDLETAALALGMMTGRSYPTRSRVEPRVAVARGWATGLDPQVEAAWKRATAGVTEVDFPSPDDLGLAANTVLVHEAADQHREWLAEQPELYSDVVADRLRTAATMPEGEYGAALKSLPVLRRRAESAMGDFDAILVPATTVVAPRIDSVRAGLTLPLTRFTRPFNATGMPVVCLPIAVDGLPVGIQVVGRYGQDQRLIAVAAWMEARLRS